VWFPHRDRGKRTSPDTRQGAQRPTRPPPLLLYADRPAGAPE